MAFHQESSYHLGEDGKVSTFGINMKSELLSYGKVLREILKYLTATRATTRQVHQIAPSPLPRFACHGGSNVEGQWKQDYQSRGGSGSFDFGWGLIHLEVTFQFSQNWRFARNGESIIIKYGRVFFFGGGNLLRKSKFRQARSIKAELMEEEAEDSDDEEYQLLGMDFWHGNVKKENTWLKAL